MMCVENLLISGFCQDYKNKLPKVLDIYFVSLVVKKLTTKDTKNSRGKFFNFY